MSRQYFNCPKCRQRRTKSDFRSCYQSGPRFKETCRYCRAKSLPPSLADGMKRVQAMPLGVQKVIATRFLRYHRACEKQGIPRHLRDYAETIQNLIEEQQCGGDLFQTESNEARPLYTARYEVYSAPHAEYWQ